MKNLKKWITSPVATVVLFAAAAALLLFSTIGGARAALTYVSDTYTGQVEMWDIGVSLLENGSTVAYRNYVKDSNDEWKEEKGTLLTGLIGEDEEFIPGKAYTEELSVANTGTINEYVRVTIYKYWTDADGNKVLTNTEKGKSTTGLAPELIKFTYPNEGTWILDTKESSQTEERMVFYYSKVLNSGEDTASTPLTGTLTVDDSVYNKVTQTVSEEGNSKTIVTSYDYDGWQFCVEAEVDAVQEHNAEAAIKSAWGRDVTVSGGTLSLN